MMCWFNIFFPFRTMPDPSSSSLGPVYGTGPDYRIHEPKFHSYQVKTYDNVHHYNKAHLPLQVHRYDSLHTYDKIRTYNDIKDYSVREYKPNFYTAPKPPAPRVPTPAAPSARRPRTPDYQWAQLTVCYEEPLGPEIPIRDYKCQEYRGHQYQPVRTEYKPPKMNTLSGHHGLYQRSVDYQLTKENYYPFRKRKDIEKTVPKQPVKRIKRESAKEKEKSAASLKHVSLKESKPKSEEDKKITPVQQVKSPEPLPAKEPVKDVSPPHPAPVLVTEKRNKTPEKEKSFVNEAERNGLAVGTSVMMISASTGTDDLKRKKRCSRWTQTTPVSSPEPSIREMTPVEIVLKSVMIGIPNKKRVVTPPKEVSPQPSPQPQPQSEPHPLPQNVPPAAVVIASDHRRQRTPSPPSRRSRSRSPSPRRRSPSPRRRSPSPRSPSPRRYYRNSPNPLPLAGLAVGGVIGGAVVAPTRKRTPTPEAPLPPSKNKTPSPKPDSAKSRDIIPAAAVVVGGTVIKDNDVEHQRVQSPPVTPKAKSPSPVNRSPTPDKRTPSVVPVVPLAAASSPHRNNSPVNVKDEPQLTPKDNKDVIIPVLTPQNNTRELTPENSKTPSPSPSVSLRSLGNESPATAAVVVPLTTATERPQKEEQTVALDLHVSKESPQKETTPERPILLSPRPNQAAENDRTEAGSSRRGLPPEVVAALEAYDNVHKKTFGDQVSDYSPAAISPSASSNLPPEVIASIEAYSKMRRR